MKQAMLDLIMNRRSYRGKFKPTGGPDRHPGNRALGAVRLQQTDNQPDRGG